MEKDEDTCNQHAGAAKPRVAVHSNTLFEIQCICYYLSINNYTCKAHITRVYTEATRTRTICMPT